MSRIRSLGARLTGRHMNTAAERISIVSHKVPMKTEDLDAASRFNIFPISRS